MKALDLFSGTGSWKKEFEKNNYEVVSVDISNKFKPTHNVDILKFDYKQYEIGEFDIISAGCPCIWYSQLQNTWIGRYKRDKKTKKLYLYTKEILQKDIEIADKLVLKTLEIIEYLKPRLWFIENPFSSLLKKRPFMVGKKSYRVDYCAYGFLYKKPTIIFTNKLDFKPKVCLKQRCPAKIGKKHIKNNNTIGGGGNPFERYKVPSKLIYDLIN